MFLLGPNPEVWECGWLLSVYAVDVMFNMDTWCYNNLDYRVDYR